MLCFHIVKKYHIGKRIHMLLLILCILTNFRNSNRMIARPCRRVIRNTGWWTNVWNTYSHARFKKLFRVCRGLFFFILVRIWHVLVRDTVCKEPNTLELSGKSDFGLISSCSDDRLSSSHFDFKLIFILIDIPTSIGTFPSRHFPKSETNLCMRFTLSHWESIRGDIVIMYALGFASISLYICERRT